MPFNTETEHSTENMEAKRQELLDLVLAEDEAIQKKLAKFLIMYVRFSRIPSVSNQGIEAIVKAIEPKHLRDAIQNVKVYLSE